MSLTLHVLGLMSGTSLDGLDLCLARFEYSDCIRIHQQAFASEAMPPPLQAKIRRNLEPASSQVDQLCELNVELADWFADASERFLASAGFEISELDLIGSHGQTFYHLPPGAGSVASTLQLGDGSWLAQRTGVTTVANFRPADMAVGGQGAPLVPFLDLMLHAAIKARHPDTPVALQNLGGMANLTWIGPGGDLLAFDTGPGNALIDGFAQALSGQPWDRDGALAAQGKIDQQLLSQWLGHDFFTQPPPRSTGRESFGQTFLEQALDEVRSRGLSPADALATITALTVESVNQAYRAWLPALPGIVYVSGGGVHNPSLMAGLTKALAPAQVLSLAELGWDPDAKEALAFACLACTSLLGICNNVPEVTGASRPVVLGQIAPGHNWRTLLAKILPAMGV
ncbi:MAG TPA: anhydro-N-acetylmuramic acid kinase [Candidatus Obscuribacterales bacterium]